MHYVALVVALSVFWLLLSGHYTLLLLSLGAVSVGIVLFLQYRMDQLDREPARIRIGFRLIHYALWLLKELVIANIDVAKRIWDPTLPIDPQWQKLPVSLKSRHAKTLYASSITLTPGTLTTDVQDDHFLVHSLSPEGMQQLQEGEMERRISKLGL